MPRRLLVLTVVAAGLLIPPAARVAQANPSVLADVPLASAQREAVVDAHATVLAELVQRKPVIELLKQANARNRSLVDVLRDDRVWHIRAQLQASVLDNEAAHIFEEYVRSDQLRFAEIMLSDRLGALVAAYPITTDYWQGDEDKFQLAVVGPSRYVGSPHYDESTQRYTFVVSVPIMEDDAVIGVITGGVDVSLEYLRNVSLRELLELRVSSD